MTDPKQDEIDVVVAALERGLENDGGCHGLLSIYQSMAREAIEALDHYRRARDT